MKLLVNNPNFSIVTPFGCNAKCNFCFWNKTTNAQKYKFFKNLRSTLDLLPKQFKQVSITGGEPTNDVEGLLTILETIQEKKKFDKVVMTTNGHNLLQMLREYPELSQVINHINISRHAVSDKENNDIFGTYTQPNWDLTETIDKANELGIDVTLSAVLTDLFMEKEDILEYINFAKAVNAQGVFFRKLLGNLDMHHLEDKFTTPKTKKIVTECPVCRNASQFIQGMKVTWKAGVKEPSKTWAGTYELIYQENGRLTADWEGKHRIDLQTNTLETELKKPKATVHSSPFSNPAASRSGCDAAPHSGGCGGSTTGCGGYVPPSSGCGGSSCG